jgi:2-polyprenyl-3-methyl-5-hydroxy-6-metoxy-1,4-benzoquinol methylase
VGCVVNIKTENLSACPFCGSDSIKNFFKGYDFETNTGVYNIDFCQQCSLKFTNPRPTLADLPKLYGDRQTADFVKSSVLIDRLRSFSIQRFLGHLPKEIFGEAKEILDFGCGDGFFANELAKFNSSLKIVCADFHRDAPVRIMRHKQITYIEHEQLELNKTVFDVIFCRHVLEHSFDPVETVRFISEHLTAGGFLIIEVPNSQSIWGKLFKRFYYAYYLPRHLFHFDSRTLDALFDSRYEISIKYTNTPLLGRSFGYLFKMPIQNIGVLGLALYPLQIAIDSLFGTSSVLFLIGKKV